MNEILKTIKKEQSKNKYFATLKYIYKKEIQKVNDKIYCAAILEEIINEKDIIKLSNDIFQILLNSFTDMEEFENLKDNLLKSKDNIIKLLNKKLSDERKDYYLALSEILIYFFERNSLIYLKGLSNLEKDEDTEPLKVFKGCNKFLYKLHNDSISEGLSYITKLFCLGYIKSYCYIFIKMHDKQKFKPDNIIKEINENDKINMVKLYIYKIIYNKNNKQINVFLNSDIINKYKLEAYEGFKDFIKSNEIEQLEQFSYDNNQSSYKDIYKKLEKYRKEKFEKEIRKDDISPNKKVNFDDFYMAAYNLILSNLKKEEFENDDSYINFYKNVCESLYKKDDDKDDGNNKLISLMKFIFEKESYLEIKKDYKFNSEDIEVFLYGYRYCLNEVKSKTGDYIYSYLYSKNNISDFDQKFYPGSDNRDEPYYELYNKIVNHFSKEKADEGCFVCLCENGYYHSVKAGFPGFPEINMKCPKCGKEIGAKEFYKEETDEKDENKVINIKVYETVKSNSNYYRIFRDNEEIKELKRNKDNFTKFEKLNYMTLEEFKEKYIRPLYSKEKGLNKIDINIVKKENKIIRNLSQLSYRLLNYILYCHLFFAKLYTQSETFDNYLPKEMTWFTMIKECFIKLKVELENKGIKYIEIFMNCIFKDLFQKLHEQKCINKFEDLVKFEDELEKLIQEKCEKSKEEINKYKELERNIIKDEKSAIVLIKELYDKNKYDKKEFPFYEHFYYTDYLDENYIYNILKGKDENDYPVLSKYLQNKKQQKSKNKDNIEDKYSLDNLNIFNKGLKLYNDKYSSHISRQLAERQTIKTSEIYIDKKNAKLIDDFIKLYNSFGIGEDKENRLKLNVEKNCICDFLLIDDNKYGQSYKAIYKKFIDKQNKELETLLDKKISSGEFNNNCKNRINVQQIKENEIFTLSKKFKFTEVIFNSSYRKYIDTQKHENYNDYEIRLEQIEEEMTNSLLKNKKLLNYDFIEFNFDNEVFSYEINDLISSFKYEKMNINIVDKEVIYNFIKENAGNNEKYKTIINNFITLIEYLNKMKKEQNEKINESTKINEIEIVKNLKNISKDFKEIFQENNNLTVNLTVSKITNIFDYYLELIFKYVKKDIEKHQEKKEINKQEIDEIFKTDMVIKKGDLASAIRLFITLVLFREKEEDKDKKIKANNKNIIDYLKNKDLWKSTLYNNKSRFEENLSKIKKLNIKVKEIFFFYNYLLNNKDEGFEEEVENYIKKKEEEAKRIKQIQNNLADDNAGDDEDISDRNDKSSDESDEDSDKPRKKNKKKKNVKDSDESDKESDDSSDEESGKKKKGKKGKKKNKKKGSDDEDD